MTARQPQPASVATVDLHGKNAYQARVAVDAALRRAAGCYRLRVVHGHHAGTALRDLVRTEYAAHPRVLRIVCTGEGMTELVLKEL